MYDVVAVKLVKRIIHADEADETAGCTPIANINGPFTMPPPATKQYRIRKSQFHADENRKFPRKLTLQYVPTPNIPAKKPANMQTNG
jgi:hypothetical protein